MIYHLSSTAFAFGNFHFWHYGKNGKTATCLTPGIRDFGHGFGKIGRDAHNLWLLNDLISKKTKAVAISHRGTTMWLTNSWTKIGDDKIWESNEVKLWGVTVDNKLKFDSHIVNICFKANQKLSVLSRLPSLLIFDTKWILFKVFFESQFKYCPLIWMFCSRKSNDRINKLHERDLRLIYDDYKTSFSDLLAIDGSFTIHHTNV